MLGALAELVSYRELIRNLVARDLKVRYRNSVLGFLWCLFNPLMMMVVFTVVFTILMKSDIPRFPAFILTGLLAWNLNSTALMSSTTSIVANANLVMKVNFPREVLPIAVVLSNTVNFVLALIPLFVLLIAYRTPLTASLLLLPVIMLVQIIFSIGAALILSALTVFFRDVEIIMETLVLAWFFLTPVFYRIEDVFPAYSQWMYRLNPMASLISAYRDILYLGGMPAMDFVGRTFVTSLVMLVVGYLFFRHVSRRFGEEL